MSDPNDPNQKLQDSINSIQLNPNYKALIRIKPSEATTKSLEATATTITLKEKPLVPNLGNVPMPHSKEKDEPQFKFNFTTIFDQNASQDSVYKVISEHCISKMIEGQNACIIGYGQTNSGKSFTIFGEDEHFSTGKSGNAMDMRKDRKGIVSRSLEYILRKAKDMEDN